MAIHIDSLKNRITEVARNKKDIKLTEIHADLEQVKTELAARDTTISQLQSAKTTLSFEKESLLQEKTLLLNKIQNLTVEKQALQKTIEVLQKQRPKLSSDKLLSSFKDSFTTMQQSLSDDRVNYKIQNLEVNLKTAITVDSDKLFFQLPKIDDVLERENLSTIRFTIQSTPVEPELLDVPSLIGHSKDNALGIIRRAGFSPGEITEVESRETEGTVLSQMPPVGTIAETGAPIDLTISKASYAEVPNLSGMTKESATGILTANKLSIGTIHEKASSSPTNTVIGQNPIAGTKVQPDSPVNLTISRYNEVAVPSVTGKTLSEVKEILSKAGLKTGATTTRASNTTPGIVLSQNPSKGTIVSPDSNVNLVIAKRENVKVPRLINLTVKAAETELKKHNLSLGTVKSRKSATANGLIIEQYPPVRTTVDAGTSVNVVISDNPKKRIRERVSRKTIRSPTRFRTAISK